MEAEVIERLQLGGADPVPSRDRVLEAVALDRELAQGDDQLVLALTVRSDPVRPFPSRRV